MSATAPVLLSLDDLKSRLAFWQATLRLSDWDIKVVIKRAFDMPHDTQGRCEWVLSRKEAFIKILDPQDWDPTCSYPQDMEDIILTFLEHAEQRKSFYDPIGPIPVDVVHFIAHVMASHPWHLLEHGTSIGGAWPSEDGQILLDFFRHFGTDQHTYPEWDGEEW